jgi:hypothetical protein
LGRKGLAEQAKRQARAQREKIEGPAWKMFRAFLKEIEGLAVNRWYGRVESIFPGTRTEMMRPRCEIVFGRMGSQGPVAEGRLHFYCQAEKPIERFSELEELGWAYFSGVILRERSETDSAAFEHAEIDFRLTDVEKAPPP